MKILELDAATNETDEAIPFHLIVLVAITAPSNVIVTTDAMPGKEWTWPAEELSNMIKKGELELTKVQKEGSAYSKIKEYVTKQLKKEAQLVKSATTGATIDVLPDAQAQKAKAELQKKGVKATSVAV